MPPAVPPDRLDAIGVALSSACLGYGLAVPGGTWSASGHLVLALALVPVAMWAAARCLRVPRRRPVAWALLFGLTLTVLAGTPPGAGEATPALASIGAAVVALGHLASGLTRPATDLRSSP